jgi:uncharacterized protein YjgD (DUF1641 family)
VTSLPSQHELLQIPVWLTQTLKQGTISLQTEGVEQLQLKIENNKLDLNFLQKELLKTLLEFEAQMTEESILKKLKNLKTLAEELKQNGLTMTISYNEQKLLTLGSEASPTISQTVTRTNAIEINNIIELIKLVT